MYIFYILYFRQCTAQKLDQITRRSRFPERHLGLYELQLDECRSQLWALFYSVPIREGI